MSWFILWCKIILRPGVIQGYRHWRERTGPAGFSLWDGLWANWYCQEARKPASRFEGFREWWNAQP